MKKLLSVITVSLLIFSLLSVSASAQQVLLIDDIANLFSESEEETIGFSIYQFTADTGYSIAVVTTEDAQNKTSQEYADDYYDSLVVEQGWSQNGILFLIDMDNREVCISTMGDCISVYENSIDYIIDSGYNELVDGFYCDCIVLMVDAAAECALSSYEEDDYYYEDNYDSNYYNNDYNYNSNYGDVYYQPQKKSLNLSDVVICLVISLVIAAITVFAVKSRYKNMGKGDEFDADDTVLNLTGSNDTVISRNVITTRVPRNNNHRHGGRGGFSGGGGSHHSSGGFSHGGGSRKF